MQPGEKIAQEIARRGQQTTTRRTLLSRSAKLAGAGVAVSVAASPLTAFARRRPGPGPGYPGRGKNDLDVLNYALTLEHLEANFYIAGVDAFSENEVEDYFADHDFGPSVSESVYERLIDVRDHEVTHVNTLISVIESLGGEPVPPCNYDFSGPLASVQAFFATAQVLEDTGVRAYDGAIALIKSPDLQTAGATIATVEARHASYFRLLNMLNPFPAAFDEATPPEQIIAEVLATGLIVSCPVPPPVPK